MKYLSLILVLFLLSGCQSLQEKRLGQVAQRHQMAHQQARSRFVRDLQRHLSVAAQERLLQQLQQLLEQDGQAEVQGAEPASQGRWSFHLGAVRWKGRTVSRLGDTRIRLDTYLEFVDMPSHTIARLNMRAAPDPEAVRLGQLAPGQEFNAIARVADSPWYLVEQSGVLRGYVHQGYIRPQDGMADLLSASPLPVVRPERRDLVSRLAYDDPADELEAAPLSLLPLFAIDSCREMTYHLWHGDDEVSGRLKLCRKQPGVWFIAGSASLP